MVIYLFIFSLLLVLIKNHESTFKEEVVITIMGKQSEDRLALIARSHTDSLIM